MTKRISAFIIPVHHSPNAETRQRDLNAGATMRRVRFSIYKVDLGELEEGGMNVQLQGRWTAAPGKILTERGGGVLRRHPGRKTERKG